MRKTNYFVCSGDWLVWFVWFVFVRVSRVRFLLDVAVDVGRCVFRRDLVCLFC